MTIAKRSSPRTTEVPSLLFWFDLSRLPSPSTRVLGAQSFPINYPISSRPISFLHRPLGFVACHRRALRIPQQHHKPCQASHPPSSPATTVTWRGLAHEATMDRQGMSLQGRLAAFHRAVKVSRSFGPDTLNMPSADPGEKHRFPGAPDKSDVIQFQVLNPITRGTNPEDHLDFVRNLLRKAKELVADFEDIASTFGRGAVERQQQSVPNQGLPLSIPHAPTSVPYEPHRRLNAANSNIANVNAAVANAFTPARTLPPPFPTPSPHPQSSPNKVDESINTQDFEDDGHRDDVQNLLVLSEVDIPPSQRKHTPKQMSCDLTEHQRIGLTWLLEQEKDRKKKGGLLAGLSYLSS